VVEKPSIANQTCGANLGLTFLPGAFIYRGHQEQLGGKPLEVLKALYAAPGKALTLAALQDKVWPDCETGEETVRYAVMVARKALRRAMKAAKVEGPADPLPAVNRGTNRTAWRLDLP
jgi:DNA-binding winged helix-turn-helix (wHTH) protein